MMNSKRHAFIFWSIVLLSVAVIFVVALLPCGSEPCLSLIWYNPEFENSWLIRLAVNLLGYATVLVPGYLLKVYIERSQLIDDEGKGCTGRLAYLCYVGNDDLRLGVDNDHTGSESQTNVSKDKSVVHKAWLLLFCFTGLLGSFLTWGLLQEKIMTRNYITIDGAEEKFTDSQFLVFVNRILALVISGVYLATRRQPFHKAPLYKYSFCSFSNIMSSWCQYEALKFVSFPTQVLAKASKIIPVMLMGKVISKKSYDCYEYITAIAISFGMTLFLLGSSDENSNGRMTTFSGVVILASYMVFDSFTSNWQGELFRHYRMTSMQMMCGVNLFSCLFTTVSLFQQGGFLDSFYFTLRNTWFLFDICLLSVTSAMGQLFIFYTISQFGPIVFVIMMTVRQGLAILLSCIVYQHYIEFYGVLGIVVVFLAVFFRIYCSERKKHLKLYQRLSTSVHKI